jgi:hypothetical protein
MSDKVIVILLILFSVFFIIGVIYEWRFGGK